MKTRKIILSLLLIYINISIVSSKDFDYDDEKPNENSLNEKIKYIVLLIFGKIEQYTLYFLLALNVRKISEPYDFFCCFIAGCILRILLVLLKKIYRIVFNLGDHYVYNEPDSTENLYIVIKKLNELIKNFNNLPNLNEGNNINKDINDDNNKDLNEKELLKLKEIEETNTIVNKKLISLENIIKLLEQNYNDEKKNNENFLKTIEDCQKYIKESFENKNKE